MRYRYNTNVYLSKCSGLSPNYYRYSKLDLTLYKVFVNGPKSGYMMNIHRFLTDIELAQKES